MCIKAIEFLYTLLLLPNSILRVKKSSTNNMLQLNLKDATSIDIPFYNRKKSYSFGNKVVVSGSLLFIVLCTPIFLMAQQLPTFTQYRELQTIINPGAIPIDYMVYDYEPNILFGATWRDQWNSSNLKHPPRTKIIRADFIPKNLEYGGLFAGMHLIHDRNGIFETTGIYGRIASVISVDNGEFSVGLNFGMVQNRLRFRSSDTGVVGVGIQDDFSGIFPDVGFGVFYKQDLRGSNFFYTGLSVPQVLGFKNTFQNEVATHSVKRIQHFNYTFGLIKHFFEGSFIEPSIWVKYVPNTPVEVDINIRSQLSNRLLVGMGFSTQSKFLNLNVGLLQKIGNTFLKIGFGFSFPMTSYGSLLGNSQEYNFDAAFIN